MNQYIITAPSHYFFDNEFEVLTNIANAVKNELAIIDSSNIYHYKINGNDYSFYRTIKDSFPLSCIVKGWVKDHKKEIQERDIVMITPCNIKKAIETNETKIKSQENSLRKILSLKLMKKESCFATEDQNTFLEAISIFDKNNEMTQLYLKEKAYITKKYYNKLKIFFDLINNNTKLQDKLKSTELDEIKIKFKYDKENNVLFLNKKYQLKKESNRFLFIKDHNVIAEYTSESMFQTEQFNQELMQCVLVMINYEIRELIKAKEQKEVVYIPEQLFYTINQFNDYFINENDAVEEFLNTKTLYWIDNKLCDCSDLKKEFYRSDYQMPMSEIIAGDYFNLKQNDLLLTITKQTVEEYKPLIEKALISLSKKQIETRKQSEDAHNNSWKYMIVAKELFNKLA